MSAWQAQLWRYLSASVRNTNWGRAGLLVAVAFLSALGGAMVTEYRIFPYPVLRQAWSGLFYVLDSVDGGEPYQDFLFQPAREDTGGVVARNEAAMQPGLTALTWFHDDVLYLVDARGREVHRYEPKFSPADRRTFRRIFGEVHGLMDRLDRVHLGRARVLPGGEALLMVYGAGRHWEQPLGLIRVDRDSNILWRHYDASLHHDFDIAPDGRIAVLAREVRTSQQKGLEYLPTPYMDDLVVILSPSGEVLQRLSLFEALRDSGFSLRGMRDGILGLGHEDYQGDFLHANNVDFITPEQARNFPHGEAGDLLISLRNPHAIGVLNRERRAFTWLTRGPWIAQHDPDILANGNILLFDNLGGWEPAGRSRILEVDPESLGITWRYEGTPEQPFQSVIRGSQQRLANGNTLITESSAGRVFEVDPAGRIVWDLRSPFRTGPQGGLVPGVHWAVRLDEREFTPEFREFLKERTPAPLAQPAEERG
ncbi:MAG: arylsulfotransferase family protein [Alphaproteobacteria bacterium]